MRLIERLSASLGSGYRVERELPPGGMSRVVIARDLTLDREVVVKILDGDVSGLSTDRFRQEIQLLARLQHPHVIPILAAGVVDERPYYSMPFVQGESLRVRLAREGPLPIEQTVRILRDTLDALAFAHAQGVIHRDIKPDNILLSTGHAVVADFGIAKALSAAGFSTTVGIALGTPSYMAPEQALADPSADHRVDLYAVGAVAYEMLTGAAPFSGSPQQMISAHITQQPAAVSTLRRDVPPELDALIAHALAKDPAARPASAAEMIGVLDSLLGQLSGGAANRVVGAVDVAATRRRSTMMAGLAVLAVAVAGATWYAMRPAVVDVARALAIIPLSAPSGDTSLVRLGRDLASTVSLSLDGIGSLTVADPATTIGLASSKSQPLTMKEALGIARQLGSRSFLIGQIVRNGAGVRLDVRLLDVSDTTSVVARATITSTTTDISALTDSLSWAVLREIWNKGQAPSPSLAAVTTHSVPAMRAFLEGERLWSDGDILHADSAYKIAATIDTAFWMAAYKYQQARGWFSRPTDSTITNRLRRNLNKLPERERALAAVDTVRGTDARVRAMKANTERYPDYAPAWMVLGDYQMHWTAYAGHDPRAALPALRRWLELMPSDRTAIGHLGWACHGAREWACVDSVRRRLDSLAASRGETESEAAFARAFFTLAVDPTVDSARFARETALRMGVGIVSYDHLGTYARRPWLIGEEPVPVPGMPAEFVKTLAAVALTARGVWDTRTRNALAMMPSSGPNERILGPQMRTIAAVTGLNVSDEELPTSLAALEADAQLRPSERIDAALLALQLRLARRDTSGLSALLASVVADTSYRGQILARSLTAQRNLALGVRGAVDSLLAVERDQSQRRGSSVLFAINRWLIVDSLLSRGNAPLVDSLTRFLEVMPGSSIAAVMVTSVAPALMLPRARALEILGRRDDALVIARGMQAVVKPITPQSAAVNAAYASIAQRLSASTDAKPSTAVPGKR